MKVFADFCKQTNSQIKNYRTDTPQHLQKFYYDLYYFLTCTFVQDVCIEICCSFSWFLTAAYSNASRFGNRINFRLGHLQGSKKFVVCFSPKSQHLEQSFLGIQLIINYRYQEQHYVNIVTLVQTVTGYRSVLFRSIDVDLSVATYAKIFYLVARNNSVEEASAQLQKSVSSTYRAALEQFGKQDLPENFIAFLCGILGILKQQLAYPHLMRNSVLFDQWICLKNDICFDGPQIIRQIFDPWLFDLSELSGDLCQRMENGDFIYPPTLEMRFTNVQKGLFLMDAGVSLFLFVARNCPQNLSEKVFGKKKLVKKDKVNQQILNQQQSVQAQKVCNLVSYLRQMKPCRWAPLYIVICGEGSLTQKHFYMHFYREKYDQFPLKVSFEEFLIHLKQENIF